MQNRLLDPIIHLEKCIQCEQNTLEMVTNTLEMVTNALEMVTNAPESDEKLIIENISLKIKKSLMKNYFLTTVLSDLSDPTRRVETVHY